MAEEVERDARLRLALPPLDTRARRRAEDDGWDINLLDPGDPDERAVLIRLAHPDLDEAIDDGHDEVTIGGQSMNPRLHLLVHETVATQIVDDDPPEVFATAKRLLGLGRDQHEVLHMLGTVVSTQIWTATHEQRRYSREEHIEALDALPDSWDEMAGPRRGRVHRVRYRRR